MTRANVFLTADVSGFADHMRRASDLIAFHRETFGGYEMMADDSGAGDQGADGGTGDQGTDSSTGGGSQGDQGSDRGFPPNTPVAQMTLEQQVAYHQHQSRKHEDRATEYRTAAGGKTAAEIKADLEAAASLRASQMSDAEKALEEARTAARQEVVAEFGTKLVAAEFKAALAHVDEERRTQIIGDLNLAKFLTDSGDVDAAKVKSTASVIAPAAKEEGTGRQDYGAGRRTGHSTSGVSAGAAMFEARKKPATTN